MDQNKKNINAQDSPEWLALHGLIFPSNETELLSFNIAMGPVDASITGEEVDPYKIIARSRVADPQISPIQTPIIAMRPIRKVAQKLKGKDLPDPSGGNSEKDNK
jgi:hypothetical protein